MVACEVQQQLEHMSRGAVMIMFAAGIFDGYHTEIWLKAMLIKKKQKCLQTQFQIQISENT